MNGRPQGPGEKRRSPFNWRTGRSFNGHFHKGWPYSVLSGMRKEMESLNWGSRLSWNISPKERENHEDRCNYSARTASAAGAPLSNQLRRYHKPENRSCRSAVRRADWMG